MQKIITIGFEMGAGAWHPSASLYNLDLTDKFEEYIKEGYHVNTIAHLQTIDLPNKQIIQIVAHLERR
ncbi:hypothetical protein [Adhaeribacter rhizoryzae]|uniref:Uncharacterized protein n=1 Tax=Adhaeribacter rhizoryzae TaxID=2607907 RepID=A0A5M6DSE6_9BACT|nr:hypothetical protein [Adhaeribacter rhizoryzae]KAA5548335.1 hypothetical protein F0145_06305 [Adhaeribacter rhizoryzae]